MAKAVNGCNKKAEEGKSVKEKEPVLFEELVRCAYHTLKKFEKDEPDGMKRFDTSTFAKSFLAPGKVGITLTQDMMYQILNGHKGFPDEGFYEQLRDSNARNDYREQIGNFFRKNIDPKSPHAIDEDTIKNLYFQMKELFVKDTIILRFALITPMGNYIDAICEILSVALGDHLIGNLNKNFIRKDKIVENSIFIGRKNELVEIDEKLNSKGMAIVSGEPGIGKTELVNQYAFDHRDEYNKIIRVRYQSSLEDTLISKFEKPSFTFNIYEIIRILSVCKNNKKSSLLIICNADHKAFQSKILNSLKLKPFHVIITSRFRCDGAIELNRMPASDAVSLVINTATNNNKKAEFDILPNFVSIYNWANGNTMLMCLLTMALDKSEKHFTGTPADQQLMNDCFDSVVTFKQRGFHKNDSTLSDHTVREFLVGLYKNHPTDGIMRSFCFCSFLGYFYFNKKFLMAVNQEINDETILLLERYHVISILKGELGYEFCHFNLTFYYALLEIRNVFLEKGFKDEIKGVQKYISGISLDTVTSYDVVLGNLAIYYSSNDKDWIICKWMIYNFCEYYFPYEQANKGIYNMLHSDQANEQVYIDFQNEIEHYQQLLTSSETQNEYKEIVDNHFNRKLEHDSYLIKEWLKDIDKNLLNSTPLLIKSKGDFLFRLLLSYSKSGFINYSLLSMPSSNCLDEYETLIRELSVTNLSNTNMWNEICKHILPDENDVPSIFSNFTYYQKVICHAISFYLITWFYSTSIDKPILNAIIELLNIHIHVCAGYTGDNQAILLCNLAEMQLLTGQYDSGVKTLNEADLIIISEVLYW